MTTLVQIFEWQTPPKFRSAKKLAKFGAILDNFKV